MADKFNDSSGSSDQKYCQDDCDRVDPNAGKVGRIDNNNVAFDVHYDIDVNGNEYVIKGAAKCFNCPYFISHFGL